MGDMWLTPAFAGPRAWVGTVHSVFDRVANLALAQAGEVRLFALCAPGVPRLPDAARVPMDWLAGIRAGEGASLRRGLLTVGGRTLPVMRAAWCGRIERCGERIEPQTLRRLLPSVDQWLAHAPARVRAQAMRDIRAGDGRRWLGLGAGLTPAFDDACVGAMALRRATGVVSRFRLPALERTTEISARYLTLAAEGYFGEPLCDTVAALLSPAPPDAALKRLAAVGASSGRDMLAGIALAAQAQAALTEPGAAGDAGPRLAAQCVQGAGIAGRPPCQPFAVRPQGSIEDVG